MISRKLHVCRVLPHGLFCTNANHLANLANFQTENSSQRFLPYDHWARVWSQEPPARPGEVVKPPITSSLFMGSSTFRIPPMKSQQKHGRKLPKNRLVSRFKISPAAWKSLTEMILISGICVSFLWDLAKIVKC